MGSDDFTPMLDGFEEKEVWMLTCWIRDIPRSGNAEKL
jgi:hypothetical protein